MLAPRLRLHRQVRYLLSFKLLSLVLDLLLIRFSLIGLLHRRPRLRPPLPARSPLMTLFRVSSKLILLVVPRSTLVATLPRRLRITLALSLLIWLPALFSSAVEFEMRTIDITGFVVLN